MERSCSCAASPRVKYCKGKHLIIIVREGGLLAKLSWWGEEETELICALEKLKQEFRQNQMLSEKAKRKVFFISTSNSFLNIFLNRKAFANTPSNLLKGDLINPSNTVGALFCRLLLSGWSLLFLFIIFHQCQKLHVNIVFYSGVV